MGQAAMVSLRSRAAMRRSRSGPLRCWTWRVRSGGSALRSCWG